MLMITGPVAAEPARKPARNRRATDVGAAAPLARPAPAPRPGRRATDPKPQPAPEAASAAPEPAPAEDAVRLGRAYAPLVAQLIAGKLGVAQTRTRRRGTPDEAVEAYRVRRRPARGRVLETDA